MAKATQTGELNKRLIPPKVRAAEPLIVALGLDERAKSERGVRTKGTFALVWALRGSKWRLLLTTPFAPPEGLGPEAYPQCRCDSFP